MKLYQTNWKSLRLDDRTILPKDLIYFNHEQIAALNNLEVEQIDKEQNYRVVYQNSKV